MTKKVESPWIKASYRGIPTKLNVKTYELEGTNLFYSILAFIVSLFDVFILRHKALCIKITDSESLKILDETEQF